MSHIFVSYKSDHRAVAGLLTATLEREGYDVWWDGRLVPGDDYQRQIRRMQEESVCTIVIWSSIAIDSPWVRGEAEWARNRGCLLPICIDQVDLWPPFNSLQVLDFRDWKGSTTESRWLKLCEGIQKFAIPRQTSTDAEISRLGHLIHKLKAKDLAGRWAYYFVLVSPEQEKAFLNAICSNGTIDLEDYGKVLASCYGEAPTPDTKLFLKVKYGFNV